MAKNEVVFGIYTSKSRLDDAVGALKNAGFSNTDVSILMPDSSGAGSASSLGTEKSSKAPEGAATGAGSGLLLGGALGWFVGVGALAIPGVGPLIAAGPILAALAGAGIGSAVGGVTGAVIGMGIPEYEAKRYETRVSAGNILLSVHCQSSERRERAKVTLEQTGAEDIAVTSESSLDASKVRTA
jgi:hypothetical protein